jgi:hypothetical protein
MQIKPLALASAVVLTATTASFAQSLPNFGPNAPGYGDSYGKPVSGTYHRLVMGDMLTLLGHTGGVGAATVDLKESRGAKKAKDKNQTQANREEKCA